MLITKREEVTKQGFCKILWRKLRPNRIYSLKWVGWGWALIWVWLWGGGGGRLLTFSAFRMGAYSRWALIRGWALIRINTVPSFRTLCPFKLLQKHCISIWVKHKTRTFFYCDLLTVNKCVLFWNKKNKVIFSTRLNQQLIFFFILVFLDSVGVFFGLLSACNLTCFFVIC